MSNRWNNPFHWKLQKNKVFWKMLGRNPKSKLLWYPKCRSPRSSSLDLQWTVRSIPEPKSLLICTCVFFGNSEKASATTRSSKRWSRQVTDKGFMFGFDVQYNDTNGFYRILK
ncbi:hypothetical protein V6N13_149640 [Hibiscus sabdariffa]